MCAGNWCRNLVLHMTLMFTGAQILRDETEEEMQQAGVKLYDSLVKCSMGWLKGRSSWYYLPDCLIHHSTEGTGADAVLLVKAANDKLQMCVRVNHATSYTAEGSLLAVVNWSAAAFAPPEAYKTDATSIKKKLCSCGSCSSDLKSN